VSVVVDVASVAVPVAPEVVVDVASVAAEAVPLVVSIAPEVVTVVVSVADDVADDVVSVAPEMVVEALGTCAEALGAKTAKSAASAARTALRRSHLEGQPGGCPVADRLRRPRLPIARCAGRRRAGFANSGAYGANERRTRRAIATRSVTNPRTA
jgi:hypothetical protein